MNEMTPQALARRQGSWGENAAVAYLKRAGWKIVGRNIRPCRLDRRCEIDIICKNRAGDRLLFVEVKTHLRHSAFASRLWKIDSRKKRVLLRACVTWLKKTGWRGSYRFDVIQIYGDCRIGEPPEIDHIENIKLFPNRYRFFR